MYGSGNLKKWNILNRIVKLNYIKSILIKSSSCYYKIYLRRYPERHRNRHRRTYAKSIAHIPTNGTSETGSKEVDGRS